MKVPHNRLTFDEREEQAVQKVIRSGQWACGRVVEESQAKLAGRFGFVYAVCVSSGLSALRLSLLSLGIESGDEVIIPAYSCVALVNAVLSVGAVPVPVDILEHDYNIDFEVVKKNICRNTKAIIIVNTFGVPCRFEKIGIPIIEDCSHGFSIDNESRPKKFQSDIVIFSFYATKLISAGEGGAVLSDKKEVIEFCQNWRNYADQEPDGRRLNEKMTDIEAAIMAVQIDKLHEFLSRRLAHAQGYHDSLKHVQNIRLPQMSGNRVWYRFPIQVECGNIEKFIERMENKGVSVRRPVENWLRDDIAKFPKAQSAYENTLSLPMYPLLTEAERNYACEILKQELSYV